MGARAAGARQTIPPEASVFSALTVTIATFSHKLREAIRFKVEQRMEGARKDRHATKKPGFPGYYFIMGNLEHH